MNRKLIIGAVLAACGVGAYFQFFAGSPPLRRLLEAPKALPKDSLPGVAAIPPGPKLAEQCEPGLITVFALGSDLCPGTRQLKKHLAVLARIRRDVAVRLVDLDDSAGGKNWKAVCGVNVASIPHVLIYDAKGKLVAGDDGRDKEGLNVLCQWINAEQKRSSGNQYASTR